MSPEIIIATPEMLKACITEVINETLERWKAERPPAQTEYVFGLEGIQSLFNCCHSTAQEYKDTFLKPAVTQRGRKMMINVPLARWLFDQHNRERKEDRCSPKGKR